MSLRESCRKFLWYGSGCWDRWGLVPRYGVRLWDLGEEWDTTFIYF